MKNCTIGVIRQIWKPDEINKNHIQKKEGKNEKDNCNHNNFNGIDSLLPLLRGSAQ
jgi:hypothetical protein